MARCAGKCCVLLLLLSAAANAAAGDWPQWRGPEASGVSAEENLPLRWSETESVRWKVPVPGRGISSPIVRDGRVYLTTSYQGVEQTASRQVIAAVVIALCVLFPIVAVACRRRRRPAEDRSIGRSFWRPLIARIDKLLVWLATFGFLVVVALAAAMPELLGIQPGDFGPAWLISGGITSAGLAAAVGWFAAGSWMRVLGCAALLVWAGFLYTQAPLGRYGVVMPEYQRAIVVAPALLAALWYLLVLSQSRRNPAGWECSSCWPSVLILGSAAATLFVGSNFWQPRVGRLRVVLCYDLETGESIWETPALLAPQERKYTANTYATPTPCCDGRYVFAHFGAGWACLDLDGSVLWKYVDRGYPERTKYGAGCSPVAGESAFFVLQPSETRGHGTETERTGPGYVVALDKPSGNERWRVESDEIHDSYTSPRLLRWNDRDALLIASWENLSARDVAGGERIWSQSMPIQMIVPSLVTTPESLLVCGGAEGGPRVTFALARSAGATGEPHKVLWETRSGVPKCVSPVVYNGLLFVMTDNGVMTCYDPATGQKHWKHRIPGTYYASLVAGDGKIYVCDQQGTTTVVAAEPEYRLLATNKLETIGAGTYASPAISNGCLILRTGSHLICIEKS